jgi:hypothetical protein
VEQTNGHPLSVAARRCFLDADARIGGHDEPGGSGFSSLRS